MFDRIRAWRRRQAARRYQVGDMQWAAADARLPFLRFLSSAERARLRTLALEFLADKQMSGARGFELSDHVRLCIALQAALPILNLGLDWYAGWVGVIVYPGDFVVPREIMDEAGVVHKFDEAVLGEAWVGGPVLLSWQDAPADADAGVNVVIHEFAHKLDMLSGAADGVPRLRPEMRRSDWVGAFGPTYLAFRAHVASGAQSWLDPYAAQDPAEFFAVTAEAFFETPMMLREDCPEVYEQLRRLFRQDPACGEAALLSAADPSSVC